jgi:hypothetical protein
LLTLGAGGVAAALVGVGAAGPAAGGPLRRASVAVTGASPSPSGTPSATPVMTIVTRPGDVGPGDLFISDMAEKDPRLVIAGSTGDELWSRSGAKSYANFRLQSYQGRPVFTWWESDSTGLAAYGDGSAVVTELDGTPIASIGGPARVSPDEHEFWITTAGTALLTSYVKTRVDLSRHGGSTTGWVMDGLFEEIDLATGKVLTHWSALDHVGLAESYDGIPEDVDERYDYSWSAGALRSE